ncbi:MAG: hypothetical protein DMD82_17030 [Candidatus Rokuibacteriota bacterium]|nr:MAG: hypothetical protein DMD82_17030 [Candidatus Rokubacteria bacterium]
MKRVFATTVSGRLVALGAALLVAGCATTQHAPPSQSAVAVYPARGQSTEQQARDGQECATWAQQQTGYDPGTSTAAGAGIGGAAIGAVTGAVGGGVIGGTQQYAKSKEGYEKAFAACMTGRGYSVAR